MDKYGRMEMDSNLNSYTGYSLTEPDHLHLRSMTDDEYNALPDKCKDKQKLFFTKPGIAFIVCLGFSTWMLISAVSELMNNVPDAGMHVFISAMLALFALSFSGLAVAMQLNRFVSRDSLVTAGEVTQVTIIRGHKNSVVGGDHVIALHGSRQLVTIRDKYPVPTGTTVLIVKMRSLQFCLYEIPSWAVSYDREETDYSAEITSAGVLPVDDYSKYDKVSVFQAQKRAVSDDEYRQIPVKYRSPRPLSYGVLSVVWTITTLATAGLLATMINAKKTGNIERFMVLLVILFCVMILEIFLTSEAFKRQLPRKSTCCIECIPVRKLKYTGNCYISVILPDKRQYIDHIMVEPDTFGIIKESETYKMYFNILLPTIKHVKGVYDKY